MNVHGIKRVGPAIGFEIGRPRLLQRAHEAIRVRHYSRRTEEAYVHWIKRLIYFHGKRHPETMGEAEVTAFLKYEPARISPIEVHLRIPASG